MGFGIAAAVGGSLLSGLFGSNSASKAAAAQERAAEQQIELEREIYGDTVERFAPFYDGGLDYYNALRYELLGGPAPRFGGTAPAITENVRTVQSGGGNLRRRDGGIMWGDEERNELTRAPSSREITEYLVNGQTFSTREAAEKYANANRTGGSTYRGFQATPGYQFMLDQGIDAIDGSAAARGNVFSGATMKAAQEYGTGLANQEYGTYLNRLTGQAAQGQSAAGNIATAGANYTSGAGNALANMGNAQAAGYIGQANAFSGGISNAIGAYGYMNRNALNPQQRPF